MKTLTKLLPIFMACVILLGLSSCICEPKDLNNRTVFKYYSALGITIYVTSTNLTTNETKTAIYNQYGAEDEFGVAEPIYDFKYPFRLFQEDPVNCNATLRIQKGNSVSGGVEVIQTSPDGSLFDINNYKLIENRGGFTKYEFTFTDDFFKDATPIEPEK